MAWVIATTVMFAVIANMPMLHVLLRGGTDRQTIGELWCFSPNNSFFIAVCAPFGIFFIASGLWWTVQFGRETAPENSLAWKIAVNWPVIFLLSIAVAAVVAAVFFFGTAWAPEKLQPKYMTVAAAAIHAVDDRYHSTPAAAKKELKAVGEARARMAKFTGLDSSTVSSLLPRLSPAERLQVLLSPTRQRSLRLLDDTSIALGAFQIWIVVSLAVVAIAEAIMLLLIARGTSASLAAASSDFNRARLAVVFAALCFLPYPYLFSVYRNELGRVVGSGTTGGQDLLAALAIAFCLVLVLAASPGKFLGSPTVISAVGLVAALVARLITNEFAGTLRTLIGIDSRWPTQVVLACLIALAALVGAYFVLPES